VKIVWADVVVVVVAARPHAAQVQRSVLTANVGSSGL
jgi:hypothetical protein